MNINRSKQKQRFSRLESQVDATKLQMFLLLQVGLKKASVAVPGATTVAERCGTDDVVDSEEDTEKVDDERRHVANRGQTVRVEVAKILAQTQLIFQWRRRAAATVCVVIAF